MALSIPSAIYGQTANGSDSLWNYNTQTPSNQPTAAQCPAGQQYDVTAEMCLDRLPAIDGATLPSYPGSRHTLIIPFVDTGYAIVYPDGRIERFETGRAPCPLRQGFDWESGTCVVSPVARRQTRIAHLWRNSLLLCRRLIGGGVTRYGMD